MQPYYAIKLKCFILRLMMGCSLLLISIGITVSIVQEIMESYDVNSKLAYILGLVIFKGLFLAKANQAMRC